MTIGIDADGILFNYIESCADIVNKLCGRIVASYESCDDVDCLKAWGVPFLKSKVDYMFATGNTVYHIPVIENAVNFIECVKELTKGDFVIVTACPASWHEERAASLYTNFGINPKDIVFTHKKHLFSGSLLVDDLPENFRKFNGWRTLMDRPWNQNTDGVAVSRAMDYLDVLEDIYRVVYWNQET
jgi:5'(3')-deoxyribonucleotidase